MASTRSNVSPDDPPVPGVVARVMQKIFFYETNLTFKRPVGAAADVKELEYISALHQTDMTKVRKDASIKDVDIASFLMSRYGILVTPEEVRKTIMHGLGGGDTEDESLDMIEVVAILLIPTLLKAGAGISPFDDVHIKEGLKNAWQIALEKKKNKDAQAKMPDLDMIEVVHRMIMKDTTGSDEPRSLSKELLVEILIAYGEEEIAMDGDVLDKMLAIAGGADAPFNVENFTKALTDDVDLYDPRKEIEESTFYYDVFGTDENDIVGATAAVAVATNTQDTDLERDMAGADVESEAGKDAARADVDLNQLLATDLDNDIADNGDWAAPVKMKKVFTNPSFDYSAGTYKSKYAVAFLWAFLMVFLLWIYTDRNDFFSFIKIQYCRTKDDGVVDSKPGCEIGNSVIKSMLYFILWGLLGMGLIAVGSFGNDTTGHVSFKFRGHKKTKKTKVMARIGLIMTTILITLFISIQIYRRTDREKKDKDISLESLTFFLCVLGVLTLLTYMKNYLVLVASLDRFNAYEWLHTTMTPDSVRSEANVKQAAAFKIDHMADNAIELVRAGPGDRSLIKSWFGAAILKFEMEGDSEKRFEDCGGILWTWSRIFSGELLTKEGIWIHARLVSTNLCHFIVAIYILFYGFAMTSSEGFNFIETQIVRMFCMVSKLSMNDSVQSNTDSQKILSILQQSTATDPCSEVIIPFDITTLNEACLENGEFNSTNLEKIFKCYNSKHDIYTEKETDAAIIFGAVVAFLIALCIAVVFIPSYTTSVLKLRSGVIPTFNDSYSNFSQIRQKPTQVSILNGMMFW
eukprot:CAMPEP_0194317770 /NCGR_PEP_ID=MMETSP0171-20130528/14493_1 /TAXON_ID=218684 /ORGANISM="Corethron pennatum, Strain L29A3" /LENGTH=802 /DNA_ID=CAMNT_0039074483 /DNA_START=35 /DNA_END=2440 /DNA_ORIENTATION=+